jgi:hypothetical protein
LHPSFNTLSNPPIFAILQADSDQHQRQQTMRANHALFDPIFIQYIIKLVQLVKILVLFKNLHFLNIHVIGRRVEFGWIEFGWIEFGWIEIGWIEIGWIEFGESGSTSS